MNPPNHALVPLHAVPTEIVAEWPAGTVLANLAPAEDGGWLVTLPGERRVDHVHPDGSRGMLAELPLPPTGIVSDKYGTFVVTGQPGTSGWQLAPLGSGPVCDLPELISGCGMARADEVLLIADSVRGHVLRADPADGSSSVWLRHQLLTRSDPATPLPGVNGVAVHDGWVYLTNTDRALLLRCPLDCPDPAARLEVVAERLVADDLDVAPDGQIYLATNLHDSVLRLDTYGYREDIAGHAQGLAGSTSVAVDPRDTTKLYATTTGSRTAPARLVRLTP
jgi:sugar lactone lactonase YvrE